MARSMYDWSRPTPGPGSNRTFSRRTGRSNQSSQMGLGDFSYADMYKTPDLSPGNRSVISQMVNPVSEEQMLQQYRNAVLDNLSGEADALSRKADKYYDSAISRIDDVLKFNEEGFDILQEQGEADREYLSELRTRYNPLMDETVQQAREGVLDESEDQAGARMRARAAAGEEAEIARQDTLRQAAAYGLNPSSGRFMSSMREANMDAAGNSILASQRAGLDERDRAREAKMFNYAAREGLATLGQNAVTGAHGDVGENARLQANFKGDQSDAVKFMVNAYGDIGDKYSEGAANTTKLLAAYADANKPKESWRQGGAIVTTRPKGIFANEIKR